MIIILTRKQLVLDENILKKKSATKKEVWSFYFKFCSDDDSICLDNHPTPSPSLQFPKQLPGEIYDSESQCKWQFGINTRLCDFRYKHKKVGFKSSWFCLLLLD